MGNKQGVLPQGDLAKPLRRIQVLGEVKKMSAVFQRRFPHQLIEAIGKGVIKMSAASNAGAGIIAPHASMLKYTFAFSSKMPLTPGASKVGGLTAVSFRSPTSRLSPGLRK